MLPVNRTTVIGGPCFVTYNDVSFYTAGDVTVTPKKVLFDIPTLRFGKKTDQRLQDFYYVIGFGPSGEVTDPLLGVLFAILALSTGESLFPEEDTPLEIIGIESTLNRVSFRNAALTKMPDLSLKVPGTPFGAVEFTAIGGNGIAFNNADRIVAVDTFEYPTDTFESSDIITSPFTGQWATTIPTGVATVTEASPAVFAKATHDLVIGDTIVNTGYTNPALNGIFQVAPTSFASGTYTLYENGTETPLNNTIAADSGTFTRSNALDAFDTQDGFAITHGLEVKNYASQNSGLYDIRLVTLDVVCKGMPVGPSMNDLIKALNPQGANAGIGKSMSSEGQDLILNGSGLYYKLTAAALRDGPAVWSNDKTRIGTLTWGATRTFTDGAPNQLGTISTSPIE